MISLLLFSGPAMKNIVDRIMDKTIPLKAGAVGLIGACFIAHIAVIAIKALTRGSQGLNEKDFLQPVTVLFYLMAMLSYTTWAPQVRVFAQLVANSLQANEDNLSYRKEFYKQLNQYRVDRESKIQANVERARKSYQASGPQFGFMPQNQAALPSAAQNEVDIFQLQEQVVLQKKAEDSPVYSVLNNTATQFVVLSLGTATSGLLLPMVRDLGQVMIHVFTCIALMFLPLAFIYSSIPGVNGNVFGVLLLIVAIQLWAVGITCLDSLMLIFESNMTTLLTSPDPADRNIVALYSFIFIGLYIGLPALVAIFWPSTGSTVASLINVGVSMAIKTAVDGGKKIITSA